LLGEIRVEEKSLSSPSPVYRFGVFQVNLAARELRKHGVRVRLPGQPFCILTMLLERPGEVRILQSRMPGWRRSTATFRRANSRGKR
jgi:DNA-binding response OmpR family regulator